MIKKRILLILLLFIFLTGFVFRQYFLEKNVPFPANLLVAAYSPWQHYEIEGYPNGPPNKPIGFDNLKLFYPYRKFTIEQLKNRQWPLWNPYNFSGNIHLATYQSAVFYPLNLVYFILPLVDAWSFLIIIQPILAGVFTYLFLKQIKLSVKASFFGAIVFAFSGWMLGWSEEILVIEHSALWLPLLLYCVEKIYKKTNTLKWIAIFIFAAASSILAGFLQITLYVFITVSLWIIYKWRQNEKRKIKEFYPFILGFLASIFLSSIHLFPAIEAYFYSPRGVVDAKFLFDSYLMPIWHFLTFLAPDFWGNPGAYNYFGSGFYHEKVIYIGLPAFLFAFYALFAKSKDCNNVFFKWFSLITLALGFFPFGWLLYYSRLPLLSVITPARIFFLSTFGFSILSAFGMEYFLSKKIVKKTWAILFFSILLIFIILWFVIFLAKLPDINKYVYEWFYPYLKKINDPNGSLAIVSFRNLILPTIIFFTAYFLIALRSVKHDIFKQASYLGLVFLSLFSSFYFANKFLYFSERKFVFPQKPVLTKLKELSGLNRIWGYGNGYIEKNMTMYYGLYSPEGYDALYPQEYGELLHLQETNGKVTSQILRTDANIKQASERESVLDNKYRTRLLSLLGVKYILEAKVGQGKEWNTTDKRFPKDKFNLAWKDDVFRIWEYKKALPRAFLVHDYKIADSKQKIADYIFNDKVDLSKTVILEKESILTMEQLNNRAMEDDVKITNYTPNKVEIKVQTNHPGLLFLSDNYYPGWKAYVDGKEEKIYRADYSFRAIVVDKGKHNIVFSYEPKSFYVGLGLTVVSALSLFGISLSRKFR